MHLLVLIKKLLVMHPLVLTNKQGQNHHPNGFYMLKLTQNNIIWAIKRLYLRLPHPIMLINKYLSVP